MDEHGARDAARRALGRHRVVVLYEDNHLLGLHKPAGLLVQGGPTGHIHLGELVDRYRRAAEEKAGRAYVGLVHRLDRNVSGALVVAKTSKAAARLSAMFRTRDERLRKTYLAWVVGRPAEEATLRHVVRREGGVTRLAAAGDTDGREAELSYVCVGRSAGNPRRARLRVELGTGLPHQIRFQLSFAGLPLEGDVKYGGPPGKRPALHALELSFPHPVGGAPIVLRAPVPEDLRRLDARRELSPPLQEDA